MRLYFSFLLNFSKQKISNLETVILQKFSKKSSFNLNFLLLLSLVTHYSYLLCLYDFKLDRQIEKYTDALEICFHV